MVFLTHSHSYFSGLIIVALGFLFMNGALADEFKILQDESEVTLRLMHDLTGRFDIESEKSLQGNFKVEADKKIATADKITFSVEAVATTIELREHHFKYKYMDAKQFPFVFLKNFALKQEKKSIDDWNSFTAELWVKNKMAPVVGKAKAKLKKEQLLVEAVFTTNISSFPIETPVFMKVGVNDEVEVRVKFVAVPDLEEMLPHKI